MRRMHLGVVGLSLLGFLTLSMVLGGAPTSGAAVSDREAGRLWGGYCTKYHSVDGCGDGGRCHVHGSYNGGCDDSMGDGTDNYPCLGGTCGTYESLKTCATK